jgi:hypothetical protein
MAVTAMFSAVKRTGTVVTVCSVDDMCSVRCFTSKLPNKAAMPPKRQLPMEAASDAMVAALRGNPPVHQNHTVYHGDLVRCGYCSECYALTTISDHWKWCVNKLRCVDELPYDAAVEIFDEKKAKKSVSNTYTWLALWNNGINVQLDLFRSFCFFGACRPYRKLIMNPTKAFAPT